VLIRMSSPTGGGTLRTVDALDTVRDMGGSCREALGSGECSDASARISLREGVGGLGWFICPAAGFSNNPYRGRGGLSGVFPPLLGLDSDDERADLPAVSFVSSLVDILARPAVVYDIAADSLMLRPCL
jgi:hypothetical protein